MKLSVIIGITQMFYGLIMRTANAIYFREWINLFNECIPMILFMSSLFGYMIFLIFFKWSTRVGRFDILGAPSGVSLAWLLVLVSAREAYTVFGWVFGSQKNTIQFYR